MPDSQPPLPEAVRADPRAPIGRNRQFRLLFLCMLVVGAGNSMLLAVAPPLVRELNLPDSSIGWIFALSAVIWVFSSPFWGRVSDRIGRKPTVAIGLGAYAVSMGSFGIAVILGLNGVLTGVWLFIALMLTRAIFGTFGSASSPAAQAYIADRTSISERTEQLSGLSSAFALGGAFGPALCAALAAWLGLVFPLGLITVVAIVSTIIIWRYLPEETPPSRHDAQRGDWGESLALMRDRRISGHLIYGFALSTVSGITAQVLGLFTMDRLNASGGHGAELTAAGFMVAALALLTTQLAVLPRLRLGPRMLMAWGAGLFALGVLLQIFAQTLGVLLVAQAIQGLGMGLARPGFVGGASVAVQPHEQGASAGLVVAVSGAGFIFSPLFGGVAYERLGMNVPLWITFALLAAMLVFTLLSRRLRGGPIDMAPPSDPSTPP